MHFISYGTLKIDYAGVPTHTETQLWVSDRRILSISEMQEAPPIRQYLSESYSLEDTIVIQLLAFPPQGIALNRLKRV